MILNISISAIACIPQATPLNGDQSCTNDADLDSECTFTCNDDYVLDGSDTARCFDDGNNDVIGEWTAQPPVCRRKIKNDTMDRKISSK